MKLFGIISSIALLGAGSAGAADYSVGIANLGSGLYGGGTAINLYSTSKTGISLIQTYVLDQKDFTGNLATPLILAVNPAQSFVYVVYTGLSQPNIVGFKIASTGLTLSFEKEIGTGDSSLQGTTIAAGPDYVIEYTYPATADQLWLQVLDQTGKESMHDLDPGTGGVWLVTGQVDSTRTYYYSCRGSSSTPPATSVSVFAFKAGTDVDATSATPLATSTDPAYIQSVCN
jgi:hypothetical protein